MGTHQRAGLMLVTALALGSTAVMVRFGLQGISALWLVALRMGLATVVFAVIIAALKRTLPRDARAWLDIAIVGVMSTGVPVVSFALALQYISSGVLTIILTLIPLLTAMMAHFWLAGEKLTITKLLGLLLAFAGVVLLVTTRTSGLPSTLLDVRGPLLALGGAIVAALGLVYARRRVRHLDAVVVTGGQSLVGLVLVMPVALAFSPLDFATVAWQGWVAVLYTGLVGSVVGFLTTLILVQRFGATASALPGYFQPIVAALLGVVLLDEIITLPLVGAGALVLGGVILADRARVRTTVQAAQPAPGRHSK